MNDLLAVDTAATADVHLGYHLPYTSQMQYLALTPTLEVQAASLNHFALSLFKLIKIRLELNVIGIKLSPWASVLVDAIRYADVCGEAGFKIEAAEI